jgi:hypothetical protein
MGRRSDVSNLVEDLLTTHKYEVLTADRIAADCGIARVQAIRAVTHLRNRSWNPLNIESVGRAKYRYLGPKAEANADPVAVECKTGTGDLLEVVGKTKAGDMIVRDVEGTLFVAKELDI